MRVFSSTAFKRAFTLVELMVVVAIIGILTAIVTANFSQARQAARDDIRKTSVKDLELAIKLFRAQNGVYPAAGCSASLPSDGYAGMTSGQWATPGPVSGADMVSCTTYIVGLTPDYIAQLPTDPTRENTNRLGFLYKSNGTDFKLMVYDTVETKIISSITDELARCYQVGSGAGQNCGGLTTFGTALQRTYAVYSAGASQW